MHNAAIHESVRTSIKDFHSGKGPIHLASFLGHSRAVSTLLSHGSPVDTPDNSGRTALHWASRKNDHTVELLLKKGADVNKPNKDGTVFFGGDKT